MRSLSEPTGAKGQSHSLIFSARSHQAGGLPLVCQPARMEPLPPQPVQFFRSTLLPAAIVVLFGLALFAVSARIWLPGDMAAPAPIA